MGEAMTKAQMKLAAELLEVASDHFSNHGCNDYEIENTPENREWLIQGEMDNDKSLSRAQAEGSIIVHKGKLITMDWLLMARLSCQLKAEAIN